MAAQEVSYTSNPTCDYEFSWTVENFSLTQDVVQGAPFSPIPGFPANLYLELQCKQVYDPDARANLQPGHSITLEVFLVDLNAKTSKCCRLTISSTVYCNNFNGECVIGGTTIYCTNFNERLKLLNYTTRKHAEPVSKYQLIAILYCYVDKLIVKGKLTFSGYDTVTRNSSLTDKDTSEACGELLKDFKTMLESEFSSDIAFSVGEKTLRAHKIILCCRSPVFANMFATDMLENNSNRVVIVDADSHAFNCFLVFLYTGIVEDKKCDTVLSLYSLAHKYQVTSLHRICSRILSKQLTVGSVCSVAVLSDLHRDLELKSVAKGFIRHHLLQVVGTTEWSEIINTKPQLMKELLA